MTPDYGGEAEASNVLIFASRTEARPVLRRLSAADLEQIYSLIVWYGFTSSSNHMQVSMAPLRACRNGHDVPRV